MKTSREELLDFGEEAVRGVGYSGFSYATLAQRAGIRKPSIHHHFPTKADLGLALIERYAERLDAALTRIRTSAETAGAAIEGVVQLYRTALDGGERMCLCSAMAADTAAISEPMRHALARANDMVVCHLEQVFLAARDDGSFPTSGDERQAAKATLAMLQGAQLIARSSQLEEDFDSAVSNLLSLAKSK